jgi:uncharacterized membrane protein
LLWSLLLSSLLLTSPSLFELFGRVSLVGSFKRLASRICGASAGYSIASRSAC